MENGFAGSKSSIDMRVFSPSFGFGCTNYQPVLMGLVSPITTTQESSDDFHSNLFSHALKIGEKTEFKQTLDVGLSFSNKEPDALKHPTDSIFRVNISEGPVTGRSGGAELSVNDLSDYDQLLVIESGISSTEPVVILLNDLIGRLSDPRPLLRSLRKILQRNTRSRLLLSSIIIDRLIHESHDYKLKARNWSLAELSSALTSSGFMIEDCYQVDGDSKGIVPSEIIFEVSSSKDFYEIYLESLGLSETTHIILTTERSFAIKSGNIGNYISEASTLFPSPPLVLFTGSEGLGDNPIQFLTQSGWFHSDHLLGKTITEAPSPDNLLASVEQLVFICDRITTIEYQDYLGIGFRVAQAKKCGLLPPEVRTVCVCHGNSFSLDYARGEISRHRNLEIDVMERISIETADDVIFFSEYLSSLYRNVQKLRMKNHVVCPLPVRVSVGELDLREYVEVSQIVFLGRSSNEKGFSDFVSSVNAFFERQEQGNIKSVRICCVGVSEDEYASSGNYFNERIEVVFINGPRNENIEYLSNSATYSLVVLPYSAESHPLAFYDAVRSGCRVIAANAGGIPEMVPQDFQDKVSTPVSNEPLFQKIVDVLSETPIERRDISFSLRDRVDGYFSANKEKFIQNISKMPISSICEKVQPDSLSVVMTNFNGEDRFLNDAFYGLRNSTNRPSQVIIVDDCSNESNFKRMEELAEANLNGFIPYRVIRNEANVGPAASRNVGLGLVTTDLVCFHDNDNVVLNDFFGTATRVLSKDRDLVAVTSKSTFFVDGAYWNENHDLIENQGYSPIGSDLGLGLQNNVFGDALSVFRTDLLREYGAWDESTRAMWEDWELFLRLCINGKEVQVIPRAMYLYRIRSNSISETYSIFDGWIRLMHALPIPGNLRYSLLRAVNLRQQVALPTQESSRLQAQQERDQLELLLASLLQSKSWRYTSFFRKLTRGLSRLIKSVIQ